MRGLGPRPQSPRVESERGALAAEPSGTPGEDGHGPQADPQANLPGHERAGGVHLREGKKQSPASGTE